MINNNQAIKLLLSILPHIDAEGLTILLKESRNFLQQERSALLLGFIDLIKNTDSLQRLTIIITEVKNLSNDNLKQECFAKIQSKLLERIANSNDVHSLSDCAQIAKDLPYQQLQSPLFINIEHKLRDEIIHSSSVKELSDWAKMAKDFPYKSKLPEMISNQLLELTQRKGYEHYHTTMYSISNIIQWLPKQTNLELLEKITNSNITREFAPVASNIMNMIRYNLNLPKPVIQNISKNDLRSKVQSAYQTCNNNYNVFKNSLADLNINENLLYITLDAIKHNEKATLNMMIDEIYTIIENKQNRAKNFSNMIMEIESQRDPELNGSSCPF